MALPQLYAPITPQAFYPDKLTINLQFSVRLGHTALDNGFRANGFRLSNRAWTYDLNLHGQLGYGQRGFTARINRPRFAAPLNCFIDLNPLRALHEHHGGDPDECSSIPDGTNWLQSNLISDDCRQVWDLCDLYVGAARTVVTQIIADIQVQAGAGHLPEPVCTHTSAHTVECAIDFYAYNPRQAVVDFMPAFSALLKDNEQREYRAVQVIRPAADLMIHGFVNKPTRIKMYCRTNRRVRFETQFRPDTFDHCGLSRQISDTGQSFGDLFGACAAHAHSLLLALRARSTRSLNLNSSRTPIDLIVALASATRRPELLREVLDCVFRTGSIQNSLYDDKFIGALKKRGLLEPARAHGFSCVASQYGQSAALLANAQEDYFPRKLRRPFKNFADAKQQARRNRRRSIYR